MGDVRLSCTLCLPGPPVELPVNYAATMVFHALVHHDVSPGELEKARLSTSMTERDRYTPLRARWLLPGGRPWLIEWESIGPSERGTERKARPLPALARNWRAAAAP